MLRSFAMSANSSKSYSHNAFLDFFSRSHVDPPQTYGMSIDPINAQSLLQLD